MRTLILCLVGVLLWASPAAAEEAPDPGWFLPIGVDLGLAVDLSDAETSFAAGGEASLAYLFGTWWTGLVAGGAYDFGTDTTRLAAGLEAGWFVLGLEAAYVTELGDAQRHGVRVGALLTGSMMTGYTRWLHFPGDDAQNALELGVLLKWPFALSSHP